ncbi:MAG TPA: glycosyltransferase family 39 protein [Pirellulales bacterium]|nr:glycosyltransferase family 39 protein [Pirellulales bacterium]
MPTTRRNIARLAAGCLAAAAAFAAYHFYLRDLMLDTGLELGAVRPGRTVYRIVPLYIYWRPRLKTGVLIASAVLATFVWWLRWSLAEQGSSSRLPFADRYRFVVVLWLAHIAVAVSVALIDGGPATLWQPFDVHRRSDYIGAVERITSPRSFLRDYPGLMPELPLHCRHHPPGGPLLLWLVAQIAGPGPLAASLATIVLAGLATPAVYLLARDVLDEAPARLAAALFLLAPNVVCYSATCLDAVFMVPLVWTFYFLWHGRANRPLLWGFAGGLTAFTAAMMTFSTSFVALWAIVVLGFTALGDRNRLKNTSLTLLAAMVAVVLAYGLLSAWSGYEPLAVLRQAFAGQDEVMKGRRGHHSLLQSAHFVVTNLVAFLFCSGLPLAWLWVGQMRREFRRTTASHARWLLLSFGLTLLLVDLAPLYTLETERIWIFLVGFLALGSAACLASDPTPLHASPLVLAALLLEVFQTILMEVLFEWVW